MCLCVVCRSCVLQMHISMQFLKHKHYFYVFRFLCMPMRSCIKCCYSCSPPRARCARLPLLGYFSHVILTLNQRGQASSLNRSLSCMLNMLYGPIRCPPESQHRSRCLQVRQTHVPQFRHRSPWDRCSWKLP